MAEGFLISASREERAFKVINNGINNSASRRERAFKVNNDTECGNITSFFIMRGNQDIEVVAWWEYFHSRDEILKFPWKYSQ